MGGNGSAPGYASTTSTNPYANAKHNKSGSSYTLNPFLTQSNQFVESNVPALLQQLLNPSLDSPQIAAQSALFQDKFTKDSAKAFENNLINPLAQRNMLRSSAMNDLAKNFSADQNQQLSNFNNQLIADSTTNTSNLINQLMNMYLTGANLGQQSIANAKGDAQQINSYNLGTYQQESANNNAMWKNITDTNSAAMTSAATVAAAA